MRLSNQERRIMQALQDGVEITTMTCFGKLGITTCSQRGGSLARMGLVTRERVEVLNADDKPVKVCRLQLTDAGRALNLDAPADEDPLPPTRNELPHAVIVRDSRVVEDLFGNQGLSDG